MLILLFALAPTSPIDPPIVFVAPEVAAERVKACGFDKVAVVEDDLLQEPVLVVASADSATEEQLRCVAGVSLESIHYAQFAEPLNERYQALYSSMAEEKGREDAREWLERRGLLTKLPTYPQGTVDALKFAKTLEPICGPAAANAFVATYGIVTLAPGWPDPKSGAQSEALMCLMNAAWASGLRLGFIGNEQYSEDK